MEDTLIYSVLPGSWIASLFFIGNILGCLAGGFVNMKLGVRLTLLLSAPVSAVTWIMVALSHQLWIILLSRVMAGIIFGLFQANGKVYNAEIAHPDLRGSIGTEWITAVVRVPVMLRQLEMSLVGGFGSIELYLYGIRAAIIDPYAIMSQRRTRNDPAG